MKAEVRWVGVFAVSCHHVPFSHQFLDRILPRLGAEAIPLPNIFARWCTAMPSRPMKGNQHILE